MAKVFMSYNRESEKMALNIVSDLESMGHAPWFDQDLSGGQAWWHQILSQIRESDVFLFVMDPHSINSTACRAEINYAAALGKPVLPVLVADGVSVALLPPELVEIQFVDYRQQDRTTALSLAKALNKLPAPKPLPDPLPPLPDVPVSYLGGLTRKIDTAVSLSIEEQNILVIDLKRSMKEPGAAEDARTLLKKLRSRRDLYAAVAEDIDELLREPVKIAPSMPTRLHQDSEPKLKPSPEEKTIKIEKTDPTIHNNTKVVLRDRMIGAAIGLVVGLGFGFLVSALLEVGDGIIICGLSNGITGAISGAICARRKKIVLIAIAGYIIVFILWAIIDFDFRYGFVRALAFGGPIGVIIGAIIGLIINKNQQGSHRNP